MNNNWRPKEWINPYLQQNESGDFINSRVFEAGADAMHLADREKLGKMAFLLDEEGE